MTAVVHSPACSIPAEKLSAVADWVDLTNREAKGLTVGSPGVREDWLLNWARLFSERIPEKTKPGGVVRGSIALNDLGSAVTGEGEVSGEIDTLLPLGT